MSGPYTKPTTTPEMTPYLIGAQAYFDGKPIEANPFAPQTVNYDEWAHGWQDERDCEDFITEPNALVAS